MTPEVITAIAEGAAVIFVAGGGWFMLRDTRNQIRLQWDKIDAMSKLGEARYRKILVALTMIASQLPENPGGREKLLDMIQKMAESANESPV